MIYTVEEKHRMEQLLAAFSSYIFQSDEIDIAYSDKTGYVRLIIAEGADSVFFPIASFDDLLEMIIDDCLTDEEYRVNDYLGMDYDRVRRKLTPILSTLTEDREYCLHSMEERFSQWQQRCRRTHAQLQDDLHRLGFQ
ncbi:MAG: hypothetical protein IJ448_04820 [Oscillospiraceae bacterium]|nr:hypothetical protein [Oscillospiraceae bacterium]